MIFLIILIAIVLIGIVVFLTWFFSMTAAGRCPICALKQIKPTKLTIDTSDIENYNDKAPKTPIMGWSSWNTFRNNIDEDIIFETAVAMKKTGLADVGYQYINIDDCWQSSMRDIDGKLQADLERFPLGMEALVNKINALDLKVGLYSSNGTLTCEDLPASLGNEDLDAKTMASWGIEYFKYDFCHKKVISGNCPIIEYVELNKEGQHTAVTLKPAHAKLKGKATVVKCKELDSKRGIGRLNHGAGSATFNIDVERGGEYVMTIHYHKSYTKRDQYVQVTVNDKLYEVFFPSTISFTPSGRLQLYVELADGQNSITFANPVVTLADSSFIQYSRMGDALTNATQAWAQYTNTEEKPIVYSICEWGTAKPWKWGRKAGNMWRTTHDIMPKWTSIRYIYEKNIGLYKYSGPAHFNDPDMLEVGNGKLTEDENKAHFTLWCMMSAPLILGNDLRKLSNSTKHSASVLNIITNKSLILIDQDPLAKSAKRIKRSSVDIIARPLQNGDVAVCFFNKTGSQKTVEFDINSLCDDKYLKFSNPAHSFEVHDLWSDKRFDASKIKTTVAKHGVKVYRISK